MTEETPPFEEALTELETIVSQLEMGELTLEEALAAFERGQALASLCASLLDQAELRLEQIEGGGASSPEVEGK